MLHMRVSLCGLSLKLENARFPLSHDLRKRQIKCKIRLDPKMFAIGLKHSKRLVTYKIAFGCQFCVSNTEQSKWISVLKLAHSIRAGSELNEAEVDVEYTWTLKFQSWVICVVRFSNIILAQQVHRSLMWNVFLPNFGFIIRHLYFNNSIDESYFNQISYSIL